MIFYLILTHILHHFQYANHTDSFLRKKFHLLNNSHQLERFKITITELQWKYGNETIVLFQYQITAIISIQQHLSLYNILQIFVRKHFGYP